jgi:pyruvate/2-oxoglutarate dehydrogenase complex dihydrolipoamide acyltransferase (E2) component
MVEEHKLDPGQIAGSGRDGRISKGDVIQHMAAPAAAKTAKPAGVQLPAATGERTEQRVPMTRLRARIAERLVQAQATAAKPTTFNEVDLTAVNEIRARYKDKFEKSHGVKLGFPSFFIKAAIEALRKFPAVNASTGSVFVDGETSDGMKVDQRGNVYTTAVWEGEVRITSPEGKRLGVIYLPIIDREPQAQICATNVAFGDADSKGLYITACEHVYRLQMKVAGVRPVIE